MPKTRIICEHKKIYLQNNNELSYCSKCYSLFIITETIL